MPQPLPEDVVRRVASLARLSLSQDQVTAYAFQLGAVLAHMDRLALLDTSAATPLVHVHEAVNRLDDDTPGAMLPTADLLAMAPATDGPFVRVPKVLVEGGGA